MPLIWAAISGHGYGHAAQTVPVLNALGKRIPDLRAHLRTTVPAAFFRDRLRVPWELSAVQQDVGCVQDGPLAIDVEATWREHQRFHATWSERVASEVAAMQALRPALVLADVPYLALAAGRAAGIATVALASLSWDLILSQFEAPPEVDRSALLAAMRAGYAQCDLALRMAPAPSMDCFGRVVEVGPIAEPVSAGSAPAARTRLAQALALAPGEHTVLVGFGGVPLNPLPFAELERIEGFRFLVAGAVPAGCSRIVATQALPFSFGTLMASVDAIVTKPGYATVIEAAALDLPVVYVRRYNFADEQPLVDYLRRHARAVELPQDDFQHGRWGPALQQVLALPGPAIPPPPSGAEDAAALIAPLCSQTAT